MVVVGNTVRPLTLVQSTFLPSPSVSTTGRLSTDHDKDLLGPKSRSGFGILFRILPQNPAVRESLLLGIIWPDKEAVIRGKTFWTHSRRTSETRVA